MDAIFEDFLHANQTLLYLGAALLLGGLIGLQRGWAARQEQEGKRIAGIRTYALVGLLGGVAALLSQQVSPWFFPACLVALVVTVLVAFQQQLQERRDYSVTSLVGLLLTFCFGAMALAVDLTLAAAAAVITALLLDNKQEIHALVNRLQSHELDAALKLLLISVVMLPLLPNENLGPGGSINPFAIWWLVVLIASISFVGYFAIRVVGTERGILFTSLFAGLSSSTALTLHFARLSRNEERLSPQLAAGILIACGTMFPRILVYCALLNRNLLPFLWWPVMAMMVALYTPSLLIWWRNRERLKVEQPQLTSNPLDLRAAMVFGALLTLVMLLSEVLREWLGDMGIFMLAAISGIVDVDAITLSLTRQSAQSMELTTAVVGIVIASATNNLVKTALATVLGTRELAVRVAGPMLMSIVVGILVAVLL